MRLLLAGGGHSHVEVLRRFASEPDQAVTTTLVSPEAAAIYSGMLPGVVAGRYALAEAQIELAPLAAAAGAQWIADRIDAVDLQQRVAHLASGASVAFDVLSLDVGSLPDLGVDGAAQHAIAVRPIGRFVEAWESVLALAPSTDLDTLVVVGGGAGGVELLLAMHQRLRGGLGARAPRWALVTDEPWLLSGHGTRVRRKLVEVLAQRNVVVHVDSRVARVDPGAVVTATGLRIAADRVFWATSAAAARWLAASGIGCDDEGFVRVNAFLQSVTHPFVFAAGDCAAQEGRAYPKAGTYAVRQAPTLSNNLRCYVREQALRPFVPPVRTLALIGTGDARAVLSYGAVAAEGAWVWRLKDRIDRRHVARYRIDGMRRAGVAKPQRS